MFKILILGKIHKDMPPQQLEASINADITFQYFLDISNTDPIPDESTIRNYRDALGDRFKELFDLFNEYLENKGVLLRSGINIDASIVEVPIQRNSKEENQQIKEGKIPENWSDKKKAHKDTDARWKKKNNQSYFGYENHIKQDNEPKLIEDYIPTDASVHDSQEIEDLTSEKDAGRDCHADSAYRSEEIERDLKEKGIKSEIHEKGYKNKPLTEEQKKSNTIKSKTRARVEHTFAWMEQTTGMFVRTIGKSRAYVAIGFMNLVYNMKRYICLKKMDWRGMFAGEI
jgi:IS5 family transposase